jgi:hypothetical protein
MDKLARLLTVEIGLGLAALREMHTVLGVTRLKVTGEVTPIVLII